MKEQVIISVGREFAAGGHEIAKKLAQKYNITIYDKDILDNIAQESGIDTSDFRKYEEKKKNVFLSRTVAGFSNSPQDIVAQMEFDFLRDKASAGESFVVVGRCANSVLKEYPCMISIFVTSSMKFKLKRVMEFDDSLTEREAERMITFSNRRRKSFHNYYCREKWGDSRYYELTISTAEIGIDKAIEVIDKYITSRVDM